MQRILTVLFLISILGVSGCQENENSSTASPESPTANAQDDSRSNNRETLQKPDLFPDGNADGNANGSTPENSTSNHSTSNHTASSGSDSASTPGVARTTAARTPQIASENKADRTERQVLEDMVNAYKTATSYGDNGMFIQEFKEGEPRFWPCEFAWYAPNLVRMEIADGKMISNGEYTLALTPAPQLWGQLLKIPAPEKTTIASLYPDALLAGMMDLHIPGEIFWVPPQVILLFAEDPLKTLVPENSQISFLPQDFIEYKSPSYIERLLCDRIKVDGPGGTRVFWIDNKTSELMRVDLPLPEDNPNVSLFRLELERAKLNLSLAAKTFTIQYPENVLEVEQFAPWPMLLQGKPLANFDKISVDSLTEVNIPLSDSAEKVIVLQFWSTTGEHDKIALQHLYKVYEKMKSNKEIQFLSVCFDPPNQVSNEDVNALLRSWDAPLPTCRIMTDELLQALRLFYAPNLVILGRNGIVAQYFQPGPNSEETITQSLNSVLEGKTQESEFAKMLKENREDFLQNLQTYIDTDYYALSIDLDDEEEEGIIAPKEMPKTLKFEKRGETSSLRDPGNILVVPRERQGEEPAFLVPFEKNRLALIDSECRELIRAQPKEMLSSESITVVRTALDSHGKQFYVATAPLSMDENRIHVFNEKFESISYYPKDRNETGSFLIMDVRVADLNGDKEPEIIFSAVDHSSDASQKSWEKGFLRAIKLDGTVLWNKELRFPYRIGIAHSDGKTSVLSMHSPSDKTVLNEFDAKGAFMKDIVLKDNNSISWFLADDLAGTGESQICACVPPRNQESKMHIAEIDRSGNQDWQYPFSNRVHKVPLEYMLAADITGDSTKEWIFASPDGKLHFLTAKGQLIDRYAHGKAITGFNVAQIAGRRILIVADSQSITTYEIQ